MATRTNVKEWNQWAKRGPKYSREFPDYVVLGKRYPPLSREDELTMFQRMRNGDRQAFDVLVYSNTMFVVYYVRRISCAYTLIPFEDMVQIGMIGLIRAIERFDPSFGCVLRTYAGKIISNRIRREQANYVNVRDRSIYETQAAHLSDPARLASDIQWTANAPSGWLPTWDDLFPPDERSDRPDARAIADERATELRRWLTAGLGEREQAVLKARILEERTLSEIGLDLGITKERTRQVEAIAMNKLRYLAGDESAVVSRPAMRRLRRLHPKYIGRVNRKTVTAAD